MKKLASIMIVLVALSSLAYGFGIHTSNLEWNGVKYAITISGELLEQSKVDWDGESPIPLKLDDAINKSRAWMNAQFPGKQYKLTGATLFFFADRLDRNKGDWAYMINFKNGVRELVRKPNIWKSEGLTFYVLMDGTLISPTKKVTEQEKF